MEIYVFITRSRSNRKTEEESKLRIEEIGNGGAEEGGRKGEERKLRFIAFVTTSRATDYDR